MANDLANKARATVKKHNLFLRRKVIKKRTPIKGSKRGLNGPLIFFIVVVG